jgi:hypothetical protein
MDFFYKPWPWYVGGVLIGFNRAPVVACRK